MHPLLHPLNQAYARLLKPAPALNLTTLSVAALIGLMSAGAVVAQNAASTTNPAAAPGASAPKGPPPGAGPGGAPGGPGGPAQPVAVEAAKATTMNLADEVTAVGTVRANELVMLRPEIAGRVTKIHFADGQMVKKAQLLVSLDTSVLDAEIAQAKAELTLAQSNYKRAEDLLSKNFVSQRAKDEALSNLQVLQARIALAQARRDRALIRAPFAGRMGLRQIAVGDYVREGADIVTLEDAANVKIDFRLPERFLPRVQRGQQIMMTMDAAPNVNLQAQVDVVDPQIDINARSFLVRARAGNAQGIMRAGMSARVRLILDQRSNAVMVPEESIISAMTPQGAADFVYKVVGSNAVRTRVQTGLRRNAKVEIVKGITPTDTIVVAGHQKLRGEQAPVRLLVSGQGGPGPAGATGGATSGGAAGGGANAPSATPASAEGKKG